MILTTIFFAETAELFRSAKFTWLSMPGTVSLKSWTVANSSSNTFFILPACLNGCPVIPLPAGSESPGNIRCGSLVRTTPAS